MAETGFNGTGSSPQEQAIGREYNPQYDPNQTITMENNPINNSFGTAIGSVISAGQVPQDRGYDYSLPYRQGENPPDYTFQNAIPTEQNGHHLGSYPQTEMYGDPKDWQRQMVRNELYRGQKTEDTEDKTMNIKNHSNVNSFGKILGNNAITANQNFQNPSSDNQTAQPTGGVSIGADGFNNPNIIGREQTQQQNPYNENYTIQQWLEDDRARGVTNPVISLLRYQTFIEPMEKQMREDNLRAAFATLRNPEATDEDKLNAYALMEYELKKPGLKEDLEWAEEAHQIARDNARATNNYRNAQANSLLSSGSGFVDRVRDLQGKIGYRAADGTNCMRTLGIALQGTPYEGQINVDQAVSTAKQYGDLHAPGDGYRPRPGDIAVVNDGNHAVMLTENGGTIQNGESHNGVYEDPRSPEEMFGGVKYWISSSRYAGGGRRGRSSGRVSSYGSAIDKQALKAQQNFEKNTVGMRKSAMALAGLQDIDPNDENSVGKYEKGMDDFAKQIEGLYDSYGLNGNKMDSTRLGIALYHELNETRSGLRPETLAEGVARAIYAKRGDVSPEELQRSILAEVYGNNGGGEQGNQQTTTNTPTDKTLQESDNRRMDRLVNGDLEDDNSEGVLVTSDGRRFTDSQLNARDMFLKERHVNPQYKSGSTWWNGMFSI